MEIRFTRHAEDKLADVTFAPSLEITRKTIETAVTYPDDEELMEDGKIRVVGVISNRTHLL